ncbi:hypothetical protein JTE90_024203 [Oedothorax gibbosus]|uniref:Uncharacterized protein n=1 Tax=Oedothorax gibbosus TaxID=931172 RepID=A0AAV6U0X2_9ARAC|nr:hypothetical protein JTE90_024203 [Oedothorax gibbosus]
MLRLKRPFEIQKPQPTTHTDRKPHKEVGRARTPNNKGSYKVRGQMTTFFHVAVAMGIVVVMALDGAPVVVASGDRRWHYGRGCWHVAVRAGISSLAGA